MKSRVLLIIAILIAIVSLASSLAACTGSDPTTTTTTTVATTTTSTTTTTTGTTATTTAVTTTATTQTTEPDETVVAHPELKRTTADELKEMLDTMQVNTDFVIVDTRDGGTYSDSHIQGAINIFYSTTGDPFEREMTYMVLPMNKPVIVYCA